MAATEEQNGHVEPLTPPTEKKMEVKDKYWLILQLIWLNLLILPYLLLEIYRKVFPPPGKSLKGQVVLVTGAGRGLGRGLALGLAKEGCKVAVADVNKDNALDTAAEIVNRGGVAKAYFTNVAKVEEIRELREAVTTDLGPVDILLNNAGLVHGDPLEVDVEEAIKGVIAVNLLSHFWMVREFLPTMRERNSGHIVAVASVGGMVAFANGSAYVASKFGVRGFMEAVRAELESKANNNVKTTTVCPYFVNTSALYVDHWDLRIPAISIEEAVEATIAAIKREELIVTIPGHLYPLLNIMRLLPQYIVDQVSKIFYVRIIPPTQHEKDVSPTAAIVKDLIDQDVI
ncbi:estradiol 17-beta-dehydrogenase 11-like isoform X2 [Homalodisca vitripennis]|nr:estradiol 17-beta-dehydrogenase 11-like isoform X2 [Homalodisca vitripennis]